MSTDRGVLTPDEKRCARCQVVKPLDEYYPRRSLDGRPFSYCKVCVTDITSDRHRHRQERLAASGRRMAEELVASDLAIEYSQLPRAARIRVLELLDTPGRSVQEVAARAGCSTGTVYRHRRDRMIEKFDAK
jgi:DNA-directed RNA polymerase specialized sigma24 family protein